MLHVTSFKHIQNHTVWIQFNDGTHGIANLNEELTGSIFFPLKDPDFFKRALIGSVEQTLVWPNGADFAPEFLKKLIIDQAKTIHKTGQPQSNPI